MERTKSNTVLTGTSAAFNPATVPWEAYMWSVSYFSAVGTVTNKTGSLKSAVYSLVFVTCGTFQLVY